MPCMVLNAVSVRNLGEHKRPSMITGEVQASVKRDVH